MSDAACPECETTLARFFEVDGYTGPSRYWCPNLACSNLPTPEPLADILGAPADSVPFVASRPELGEPVRTPGTPDDVTDRRNRRVLDGGPNVGDTNVARNIRALLARPAPAAAEMEAVMRKLVEVADNMTELAHDERACGPEDFAEQRSAVKEARALLARIDAASKR